MAGFRLFRGYVQRTPKFLACFQVARGEVHTKAVRTIEELESVYNERKCFINGKLCYHWAQVILWTSPCFQLALHLVSGYLHPCLEQLRLESFTVTSVSSRSGMSGWIKAVCKIILICTFIIYTADRIHCTPTVPFVNFSMYKLETLYYGI